MGKLTRERLLEYETIMRWLEKESQFEPNCRVVFLPFDFSKSDWKDTISELAQKLLPDLKD